MQGSEAANAYCKSELGKVTDITKVLCSDKESSGLIVRGHCTVNGSCLATEYKDLSGVWRPVGSGTSLVPGTIDLSLEASQPARVMDLGGGLKSALPLPTGSIEGGVLMPEAIPVGSEVGDLEAPLQFEDPRAAGASTQSTLQTNSWLSRQWAESHIAPLEVSSDLTLAAGVSGLPSASENPFSLGSPAVAQDDWSARDTDGISLAKNTVPPDPDLARKILEGKVQAAQTAATEAKAAISIYDDPRNNFGISYEAYGTAQEVADKANGALEKARNDLAQFNTTGTVPSDTAGTIDKASAQIQEGQGRLSSFFRGVADAGSRFAEQPIYSPLPQEQLDQMPFEAQGATALAEGTGRVLGGTVAVLAGDVANVSELLGSTPSAEEVVNCAIATDGCLGKRLISAGNLATLAVGGMPMAVERVAVGEMSVVSRVATDFVRAEIPLIERGAVDLVKNAEGVWGLPVETTAIETRIPTVFDRGTPAPEWVPAAEAPLAETFAKTLPAEWPRIKPSSDLVPEPVVAAPEPAPALAEIPQPPRTVEMPASGESLPSPVPNASASVSAELAPAPSERALKVLSREDIVTPSEWKPAQSVVVENMEGVQLSVSSNSFPLPTAHDVIKTPKQYEALMDEFIPGAGARPTYVKTWTSDGIITTDMVYVPTADGTMRTLDMTAYSDMRILGDDVYGVTSMADGTYIRTAGKIVFDSPISFPDISLFPSDSLYPAGSLTPLSSQARANFFSQIHDAASQLPESLYERLPKQIKIMDFTPRVGQEVSVRSGGFMTPDGTQMWIHPGGLVGQTYYHELGHALDSASVLPSNAKWGIESHGLGWRSVYANDSGAEAINSGIVNRFGFSDRPEGFACTYGYCGGSKEDKATVVEYMLSNYPAMAEAAQNDSILAAKIRMVKDSFYTSTGGEMNDAWWNNLKVSNPDLQVGPSAESIFVREFELWRVSPQLFPPIKTFDAIGQAWSQFPVFKWIVATEAALGTWWQSLGFAF